MSITATTHSSAPRQTLNENGKRPADRNQNTGNKWARLEVNTQSQTTSDSIVRVMVRDNNDVLTCLVDKTQLCANSKLFDRFFKSLPSQSECFLTAETVTIQLNEQQSQSMEATRRALRFLSLGSPIALHDSSSYPIPLLNSYLTLGGILESGVLCIEAQRVFLSQTPIHNLDDQGLSQLAEMAEKFNAKLVADTLLDYCIESTTDEKKQIDARRLGLCQELLKKYGHLKSYINVTFEKSSRREINVSTILKACSDCSNIEKINVDFFDDMSFRHINEFNEGFIQNIFPNLPYLLDAEMSIIVAGECEFLHRPEIMDHLISALNNKPSPINRLALNFQSLMNNEATATEIFQSFSKLTLGKVKSLLLNLDTNFVEFVKLPFMKNIPIERLTIETLDDIEGTDLSDSVDAPVFRELSTYPHLNELRVSSEMASHIADLITKLPFNKLTFFDF